jgi:hypothetical protein
MLNEFALRNHKPCTALYKVADRDGMYVTVSPARDADNRPLWPGRDLARLAREKLLDARRAVSEGRPPAVEKREKRPRAATKTFDELAANWLQGARMADATREHPCADIVPAFKGRLLGEVTAWSCSLPIWWRRR